MSEHDVSPHQDSERDDRGETRSGPIALVHAIARLSRAATGDFAADSMLRELCETAGAFLQVDSVGVMGISTENGAPLRGRFVHANTSTEEPEKLQEAQRLEFCHRRRYSPAQPLIAVLSIHERQHPIRQPIPLADKLIGDGMNIVDGDGIDQDMQFCIGLWRKLVAPHLPQRREHTFSTQSTLVLAIQWVHHLTPADWPTQGPRVDPEPSDTVLRQR